MGAFEVAMIITAIVGAGVAVKQQNIAEDAAKAQTAESNNQVQQSQRQAIREKRIKLAQVEQMSANSGTAASSGELGAVSSLETQSAANQNAAINATRTNSRLSSLQSQSNSLNMLNTAAQSVFKVASVSPVWGGGGSTVDPNSQMSALNQDPFSVTS